MFSKIFPKISYSQCFLKLCFLSKKIVFPKLFFCTDNNTNIDAWYLLIRPNMRYSKSYVQLFRGRYSLQILYRTFFVISDAFREGMSKMFIQIFAKKFTPGQKWLIFGNPENFRPLIFEHWIVPEMCVVNPSNRPSQRIFIFRWRKYQELSTEQFTTSIQKPKHQNRIFFVEILDFRAIKKPRGSSTVVVCVLYNVKLFDAIIVKKFGNSGKILENSGKTENVPPCSVYPPETQKYRGCVLYTVSVLI